MHSKIEVYALTLYHINQHTNCKFFKARVYTITKLLKFITYYQFCFVETTRKSIILKLSICELGSSSVLIMLTMIRIESFAIINLRSVSTKLHTDITFTMHANVPANLIIINYYILSLVKTPLKFIIAKLSTVNSKLHQY